jgi:hypothetical protein
MLKKVICVILILSFALVFAAEMVQNPGYNTGYNHGKHIGKKDASWLWAFAGFGCNCFGMAAAYLMPGKVPSELIIGQAPDYSRGFADGYIRAKRWRQVMWAGIGAIVNSIIAGSSAPAILGGN